MKKFLSILLMTAFVFTFAFSPAYADSSKSQKQTNNTISIYKNKIKELQEQLKKYRKDEAKKAKILKEIAKEKKKNNDNTFNIIVNGTEITLSNQPVIKDGKLLLPVRPITKALGAKLDWYPATKTIVITKGDIKITLTIGSNIATVNNIKTTLEHKVELKDGGTMIPIGVIAKILKGTYNYDKDSKVIIVDEDDKDDEEDNDNDDVNNNILNIAWKKPATASTTSASQGTITFAAANAFDGKQDTRWSSEYTDPQWLAVDLQAQKYIGKIKLFWEAAYAKTYVVQLSDNGVNWVDVFTTTTGDGNVDEITIPSLPARYIRVYGLQRATSYGYSLKEVEVYEGVAPAGTLTATPAAISGSVNLTTEGTVDWTNWGYGGINALNRKLSSTNIINYTILGTAVPTLVTGNPVMYSWTDGNPVVSVTNSVTATYVAGLTNGFQFVVPADTTLKTLKIYVAAFNAKGKLEATLSDGSAADYVGYVDSPSVVGCKVFTINYKALSAGQVLKIKYTVDKMYSSDASGISLQSAALK